VVLIGVLVGDVVLNRLHPGPDLLLVLLAAGTIAAEPLVTSITLVRLLGRPDTRQLAAAWIAAHAPPGTPIVTWGAPPGSNEWGRPSLDGHPVLQRLAPERWAASGATLLVHHTYPLPWSADPLPQAGRALRTLAVFDPFEGPVPEPVLEPLDAFYLPLARFGDVVRPGPRITIAALDSTSAVNEQRH
jgi:hypothetical protein